MHIIAQRYEASKGSISGLFTSWRGAIRPFIEDNDWNCYLVRIADDGKPETLIPVTSIDDAPQRPDDRAIYVRVRKGLIAFHLTFASLTSSDEIPYDVKVEGEYHISDPEAFLRNFAFERILATGPISTSAVDSMLATRGRPHLIDTVSTRTYEYVKDGDNLPTKWWSINIPRWAEVAWLEDGCTITQVLWESPTEDRRREMEIQREQYELQEKEAAEAHHREVDRLQREREIEQKRLAIENDRAISEAERESKLREINTQEEMAIREAEIEGETRRLELMEKNARLELEITELREGKEAATRLGEQYDEILLSSRDAIRSLTNMRDEVGSMLDECRTLIETLKESQPGLDQGGWWRTAVSAGKIGSRLTADIEGGVGPAALAQAFRERQKADCTVVSLRKTELKSRAIGASTNVSSLRIGATLQFEMLSQRDGFATIINFGTSGKIWLHCPSAYIAADQAVVRQGQIYAIPGESMIPESNLAENGLAYIEYGPTGWEELVVIVSDAPIIESSTYFSTTPGMPFTELTESTITALVERLSESPETWHVGILSFLVEK